MTSQNVQTKIEKVFTLSSYEKGTHRTTGFVNDGEPSFAESSSPLTLMIDSFRYRPLGTKIKVIMEEID